MEQILLGIVSFVGILLATLLAFVIRGSFTLGGLERGDRETRDRLGRIEVILDRFEARMDSFEASLGGFEASLGRFEARLDGLNDELRGIGQRLARIEEKLK